MTILILLNLLTQIKELLQKSDVEGLNQAYTSFKQTLQTLKNPIIKELNELKEFMNAFEDLLRIQPEQSKMLFHTKSEFLQLRIRILESSLKNVTQDFENDLNVLSEAINELEDKTVISQPSTQSPIDKVQYEKETESDIPISEIKKKSEKIVPGSRPRRKSITLDQEGAKSEIKDMKEETIKNEMLQRNTRISYFSQMNPETNYMLTIKISKKEIERLASEKVSHVYSSFQVEKQEKKLPIIKIIPFFPGCLITPPQVEVNIDEEVQDVIFWITPLVLGKIDSFVEFWYEGKRIDKVETPTKIVNQTLTKIVASAGIVTGVVPSALEFLQIDVNSYLSALFSNYWPNLAVFFNIYGILMLEITIVSILIGLSVFLFLKKKPKKKEVEK